MAETLFSSTTQQVVWHTPEMPTPKETLPVHIECAKTIKSPSPLRFGDSLLVTSPPGRHSRSGPDQPEPHRRTRMRLFFCLKRCGLFCCAFASQPRNNWRTGGRCLLVLRLGCVRLWPRRSLPPEGTVACPAVMRQVKRA